MKQIPRFARNDKQRRPQGVRLIALVLLTACEIEKVSIPRTEGRVALHAVLSASAPTQVVLLERTRTGSVFLVAPPFDLADPVVSDEGIAETGAFVQLVTPDGQTLVAREDNTVRGDGKGAGIYRFALPGADLERGATYQLSVRTSMGEELAAESAVPAGTATPVAERLTFDRSRDTLALNWPATAGARAYFVRIETPYGPRSFFTEGTQLRLPGELRNVDVTSLPRVFIPGFPQAITVSAVDSNYYDWYRTGNNALTGTGLINRVRGGLGVFGSLVRLRFQELRVTTPQAEAAAGNFVFTGTPLERTTTPYLSLELHLESRSVRADQGDALSGRFVRRPTFSVPREPEDGLLGTVRGERIVLAFLRHWSARDTVEIFTGEIRGDTIVGSYRGFGGVAHFVRVP